ncbi:MAG: hypothetical protein GXP03_11000 [Alphaproteobacteria bacterium]|nr:hypothetical protein [Alphaproteobacteria bacterium]
MKTDLTNDHRALNDALTARRYFAKFDRILGHLDQVAELTASKDRLGNVELNVVRGYLQALSSTFEALSNKYLMSGRVSTLLPKALNIDTTDSGFPVYGELLQMANDALQVDQHLGNLASAAELKKDMVRHILNEFTTPTKLQFALSQRLYYERLAKRNLFWPQNDPQIVWLGTDATGRRSYVIHWATYDSQVNIPTISLMLLEDTGDTALPRDEKRWPQVQSHLIAQSMLALKLVTIASGFDQDFDDLHPKLFRRIQVGPMYSDHFTHQTGPIGAILADARGGSGNDWALAWTVETLLSDRVEREKKGFFGSVEREIYKLDHFGKQAQESGATEVRRALILPQRPYQVLEERKPPGFVGVHKYVVSESGQILSYR